MARRGRRQVLQLDDVSSSLPTRFRGFESTQNEQKRREQPSSSLLNLVAYSSDLSSDEDQGDAESKAVQEAPPASTKSDVPASEERNGESVKELEIPLPTETQQYRSESPDVPEPALSLQAPVQQSMQDIPLPHHHVSSQRGEVGSSIDSEVASFLAEIESISAEPVQNEKPETDDTIAADSSQPAKPDFGFIPRSDASVPLPVENCKASSPKPVAEEKRSQPSSSANAYKSMFVKGASEFVKKETEDEHKKKNGAEFEEEELPEEPVSQWQMVQDDATQYYYYWNLVTNEVTWEIPPDYTQYLLLYKEYEERIASIPKDKLLRMKERKEKKRQATNAGRETSPAPSSSQSRREKKHKKDKHRKEPLDTAASSDNNPVEIGPHLPPSAVPESSSSSTSDAKAAVDEAETEKVSERKVAKSSAPNAASVEKSREVKFSEAWDSAVDSTSMSVPEDVEAIFDAALSAVAEGSANSNKSVTPTAMSSSSIDTCPATSTDTTVSTVSTESVKPTSSVDSSKFRSSTEMDSDTITSATACNSAVVSSSSVVSTISGCETECRVSSVDKEEVAVSHSGVSGATVMADEEEEDDFDMDFDDIDHVDWALEKALEKKLEKKKAELEKLEKSQPDSDLGQEASVLLSSLSEQDASECVAKTKPLSSSAAEPEPVVSSSVKIATELSPSQACSSKSLATSSTNSLSSEMETDHNAKAKGRSRAKRSAAESSTDDDGLQNQEKVDFVKKARLVAYDAPETDDESMDTSEEVNPPVAEGSRLGVDFDTAADVLPTPPPEMVDSRTEIQEMSDTALAKLAFLDVTSNGLSALQIGLVALQTRLNDWQNGGLNGVYFHQRLREIQDLLKQYETTAVPPGWSCEWDSNFRRYFYVSASTGEAQWEYPELPTADPSSTKKEEHRSKKTKGSRRKKTRVFGPEPFASSAPVASSTDGGDNFCPDVCSAEDINGVAMKEDVSVSNEVLQVNEENMDSQPSTSTTDIEKGTSDLESFFPGEPLPPGTELLLGLPPPPPPPIPADEMPSTTDDAYVCSEDSSDDSGDKDSDIAELKGKEEVAAPNYDPDIDGEEMVEEDEEEEEVKAVERGEGEGEEAAEDVAMMSMAVTEDPAVISRPPQLRCPPPAVVATGSSSALSSVSATPHLSGVESSSTISAQPVLSGAPVLLTATPQLQPDSVSSVGANCALPGSPKLEDSQRSGDNEVASSSTTDHHKPEKHKKKKKDKLGSHTMSLKKKGVSSLVQKWQKVKKEAEKEERASEQRQMAIRQQLEEWKKENS